MFFEKIMLGVPAQFSDTTFIIYCNKEAFCSLPEARGIEKRYIPALNSQYSKILWLQFFSSRQLRQDGVDLFWVPSGCNAFPGPWGVPSLVTFCDFGEYYVPQKYDSKRMLCRKLIYIPLSIRRGASFSAISHSTADDLKRLFGKNSAVIYPGISPRPSIEELSAPVDIVRKETKFNYEKIVLVPGRTDFFGKGLDVMLTAYRQLIERVPGVPPLVLVGPKGEGHERLQREILRLGLKDDVRWLGRVSDICLDALYNLCSFVVFPSRFEGFGFPLLEAMRYGKPIISSDAGSLPEVADDAALFFPSGNSSALAVAMERILVEPDLRERLVAAGMKRIDRFEWRCTINDMHSELVKLAKI